MGEAATAPEYRAARAEQLKAWETVFSEDVAMMERMQRGRASPAYLGGAFSPVQDIASHHFHCWVARGLLPASSVGTDCVPETAAAAGA